MKDSGPTAVMRFEHEQIKGNLKEIYDKVKSSNLESDNEEHALLDILYEHNMKEEKILYPMIDHLSSDEERTIVFRKMEEVE